LRICRFIFKAGILILQTGIIIQGLVTAESATDSAGTSITAPQMPTVTAPAMPTITTPVIDNNFYDNGQTTITTTTTNNGTTTSTTKTNKSGDTSLPVVSDTTEKLKQTDESADGLTAADLTVLDKIGALGNISSIINKTSSSQSGTGLLEQLLTNLSEIKKENKTKTEQVAAQTETADIHPENRNGSILRFTVNGYDITGTCRTVYFSQQEKDGSFLLTGDRKYLSGGKPFGETFYLLFKSDGYTGGTTTYNVLPYVLQTTGNPYSFMYKISQQQALQAQKTGNLVTMRISEPKLVVDLLLDIGTKAL
jgi:hypothetical protein